MAHLKRCFGASAKSIDFLLHHWLHR
jgi:hypothetical protein